MVFAYGDFFSQWVWDHVAILTLGRRLRQARRIRQWNQFIGSIERLTHGRVGRVQADEEHWSGCGTREIQQHFHDLLKCQNAPSLEAVAALWKSKAGDAQVEVYGSGGGAAWYLAKIRGP